MNVHYLPPRQSGKTLMSMDVIKWRIREMKRLVEKSWNEVMGSYTKHLYSRGENRRIVIQAIETCLISLAGKKGRSGYTSLSQRGRFKSFDKEINRYALNHSAGNIRGVNAEKIYWFEEEN
ncbi:hypothetical protein C0431_12400 [bacterium]|nr:hypothetical protein [bacterium]